MKKLFFTMFFAVGLSGMDSDDERNDRELALKAAAKKTPTYNNFAELLMQKDCNGNTLFHQVVEHEKNLKKIINDLARSHHGETEAEHAKCKAEFVKGKGHPGTFDEYVQHQRTLITETLDNLFAHVSERKYIDCANDHNETPLYVATECEATYLVEKFLAKGADPDKKAYMNRTPLELACNSIRNPAIIKLLMEKSSNTGIVSTLFMVQERGDTLPLHAIAKDSLATLHMVTQKLSHRSEYAFMEAFNELTKKDEPDAQQEDEKQ